MANLENNINSSKTEQQCDQETLPAMLPETLPETRPETLPETLTETNEVVLETLQNSVGNAISTDTGSANIPGRDNERKLFVGGLTGETTEEDLRAYFTQYGPIDSVRVKIDPQTQRSKGFAFIVFSSAETIAKVTEAGPHIINNKKVDAQLPKLKQGKIFVGGITAELSEEDIKGYFSQFGNVVELQMPFDKVKNQKKNFCFVIFNSEDVAEQLIKTPKVSIKNVEVDVKKAISKSNSNQQQARMSFAPNSRQNVTAQSYGQNFEQQNFYGQNWNGPPMLESYGFGQQGYGNLYAGAVYNTGYESSPSYPAYGNFENQANIIAAPNRNNSGGFTRGTGRGGGRRGAGRRAGRGAMGGQNSAGSGNGNVRYQPY